MSSCGELCTYRLPSGALCLQPVQSPSSGLCPLHAAALSSATSAGAARPWDGALHVVLDLDQTLVHTPAPPTGPSYRIRADGNTLRTAVRPYALEFLLRLASAFDVSVVTGGSPDYCRAVVKLLNGLCARGSSRRPASRTTNRRSAFRGRNSQQKKPSSSSSSWSACLGGGGGNDDDDEDEDEENDEGEGDYEIEGGEGDEEEEDREMTVIAEHVSCRDCGTGEVKLKDFSMVGAEGDDARLYIAVDNCRRAWAPSCRDAVVVVPDWAPDLLPDEQESVLREVARRVFEVRDRLKREAGAEDANGQTLLRADASAGEILQAIYEEEEKARILQKALNERVDATIKIMREKVF